MVDYRDIRFSDVKDVFASYVPVWSTYNQLGKDAATLAKLNGLETRAQKDAFRHTYSSAILTQKYGAGTAELLGTGYELVTNPFRWGQTFQYTMSDTIQDLNNNAEGRESGLNKRGGALVEDVLSKMETGEVITSHEAAWKKYQEGVSQLKEDFHEYIDTGGPFNLERNREMFRDNVSNPPQSGGFFNAIGDFFGSIFSSPAAAAEPPAAKSDTEWKRVNDIDPTAVWKNTVAARSQQNKVTTPPFTPPMNGDAAEWGTGSAGANMMNNMFDSLASNIAGQAVSMLMGKLLGGGVHTSSRESARSTDALASFKLSRGQMQAQLLEQMTRGKRNI